MSTVSVTNLKHGSSASNNLVLDANGNVTAAGTVAMATPFAMRNKIINGAMVIDQRNAGASITPTNDSAGLDRWKFNMSVASKYTAQQVTDAPSGFSHSLKLTSSSAYTVGASELFATMQPIEGFNFYDLSFGTASASAVTISFWVKSSLTGNFGGSLSNYAQTRFYPFSYSINFANTWERKTITIAGDTSGTWVGATNAGAAYLWFSIGAGSSLSQTAGAWTGSSGYSATGSVSVVGTNAATWQLTGVQLEVGSVATPFERRLFGTELQLAKRYYDKTFAINTAPAQNAGRAGALETLAVRNTSGTVSSYFRFSQPMRTSPTMTFYNPQAANAQARNLDTVSDCTGTAVDNINEIGGKVFYSLPAGASSTNLVSVHWSADAEL